MNSIVDMKKYGLSDNFLSLSKNFDGLLVSRVVLQEKGLYRSEGKDYVMQDGDVVLFRFNV